MPRAIQAEWLKRISTLTCFLQSTEPAKLLGRVEAAMGLGDIQIWGANLNHSADELAAESLLQLIRWGGPPNKGYLDSPVKQVASRHRRPRR
jgi:hypothetical protein